MEKNSRIHFEEINILSVVARAHSKEICTKVFFFTEKKNDARLMQSRIFSGSVQE